MGERTGVGYGRSREGMGSQRGTVRLRRIEEGFRHVRESQRRRRRPGATGEAMDSALRSCVMRNPLPVIALAIGLAFVLVVVAIAHP